MLSKTRSRPLVSSGGGALSRVGLLGVAFMVALALFTSDAFAAQPPVNLGTADGFAVLAGQTVTNTGPSTLNGDLGVSPGTAVTGFRAPGVVNGTIHAGGAVARRAQTDLQTAYNDAAGRAPAMPVLSDLGASTLTAGVYRSFSSLALTGTLTLDARGDPNAVFVFQAASTLTTAPASRVNLVNGAQPCNVFWQSGSSATLGASSLFAGSILASDSIAMSDGAALSGRALARNGSVTLINDTITAAHCAAGDPAGAPTIAGTTGSTRSCATSERVTRRPARPVLRTPRKNARVPAGEVKFRWRPAARAARYTLIVDRRKMNTGCATTAVVRLSAGSHTYRVIAKNRHGARSSRVRGFSAVSLIGDLKDVYDFIADLGGRALTIAGGAVCGEAGICEPIFGKKRNSPEWLTGEILGGIFALGDVRDALLALGKGELGEAALSVAGLVPVAGDAFKSAKIIIKFLKRNAGKLDEAMGIVARLFGENSALTRKTLDLVTGGGYSKVRRGGISHVGAEQLVRSGNNLARLTRNATLFKRTLNDDDRLDIEKRIKRYWPGAATNPNTRAEALGVESTLQLLHRDENIKVLLTGRRSRKGPDIVAVDKKTGRTIVIEVKGTQSKSRPLGRSKLRTRIQDRGYTQLQRSWLRAGRKRYLNGLLKSPHRSERSAGKRLERIILKKESYDARIYQYRPKGGRAYGPGLDRAAEEIRRGGGVHRVQIIDVSPE